MSPQDVPHAHDGGLARDLAALDRLVARRGVLGWIGGAGMAALLPSASAVRADAGSGQCIAAPPETAGPYPADGTNRASGPTSNALAARGIVRSDIRPSFIGSTRVAAGLPLDLELTLVDATRCTPLAGHAVYIWQADAEGLYSLYSAPQESWLRGVQRTDAAGRVRFTSIVPGCYRGRYPHLHVQIFAGLDAALTGRDALLTSQLIIPAEMARAAFADAARYPGSAESFARFSLARDYVFADNSAEELAAMTLAITARGRGRFGAQGRIALAT